MDEQYLMVSCVPDPESISFMQIWVLGDHMIRILEYPAPHRWIYKTINFNTLLRPYSVRSSLLRQIYILI